MNFNSSLKARIPGADPRRRRRGEAATHWNKSPRADSAQGPTLVWKKMTSLFFTSCQLKISLSFNCGCRLWVTILLAGPASLLPIRTFLPGYNCCRFAEISFLLTPIWYLDFFFKYSTYIKKDAQYLVTKVYFTSFDNCFSIIAWLV